MHFHERMSWVPKWIDITITNDTLRGRLYERMPNKQCFIVRCKNVTNRYTMEWKENDLFVLSSGLKRLDKTDVYKSIFLNFMEYMAHEMTSREVSLLPPTPLGDRINVNKGDTIYCPDGVVRTVARNFSPPRKYDKFAANFTFTDGHQFTGDFNWFVTTPLRLERYAEYPIMCASCLNFCLAKFRDPFMGPFYVTKMKGFYCGICFDQLQEQGINQYDRR